MPEVEEIQYGSDLGLVDKSHKYIYLECPNCGKLRWIKLIKGKPAYNYCNPCMQKRIRPIGDKSTFWKGGKHKTKIGYVLIWLSLDNFFYPMINGTGYVFEHRLVMAKHLNHCLLPWEVVHHKNGIRDDNRLENLELLPTQKYHVVDSVIKQYIKRLESKMDKLLEGQRELRTEVRLLRFENKQLKEQNVSCK